MPGGQSNFGSQGGGYGYQGAYGEVVRGKVLNVNLPPKLRCSVCEKNRPPSAFSSKQLNEYRYRITKLGHNNFQGKSKIRCRACTGQQTLEMECSSCNTTKGLEEFALAQRSDPDNAKCNVCMEQLAGVVPNDPDDQIERTLEDDSTENSSEYSGHAGYIPPDYSDDTVYQMDVNGQYATNSSAAASHSGQGSHSGGAKVPRIVPGSDRSPALSKPAKEPVQAKLTIEALEHLRIATGPESAHAASRTGHFVKHGGFASTAASEAGKSTISNAGQRYNLAQQGPNSNSQSRGPGYTGWDSSGQPHERTQAPPASVQSTVTVLTRPKVQNSGSERFPRVRPDNPQIRTTNLPASFTDSGLTSIPLNVQLALEEDESGDEEA